MSELFTIDKSFSFCYSHRVFVQEIDTDLTEKGHTCAKCRRLHGHEGLVKVFLEGENLNDQSMIFDFVNLGFIKDFLDDTIDHRFIISRDDPWFANITNASPNYDNGKLVSLTSTQPLNTKEGRELKTYPVMVDGTDLVTGYNIDLYGLQGPEKEVFESYFIVDFVPTSENLAKWLFDIVDAKLSPYGATIAKVEWNETPKSRAIYSRKSK